MKRYLMLLAAVLLGCSAYAQQRNSDWRKQYEAFKQTRRQEYQDFKAKANADFANFLKQQWKDYRSNAAQEAPIPTVMPQPQQFPTETPSAKPLPEPKPDLDLVTRIAGDSKVPEKTGSKPQSQQELAVEFFGDALQIPWSQTMSSKLSSVSEAAFSDYWGTMSSTSDAATRYLTAYAQEHKLNGWGYYQLVKKVSEQCHANGATNERIAMQAFLLSQLKFRAQVAVCGSKLVLLLPFREQVYAVSYLTINGVKYYIYGYDHKASDGYRTYENKFTYADQDLSLAMEGSMDVGMNMSVEMPRWSSILGESFSVPVDVGNIALLMDYPIVDAEVYYRQGIATKLAATTLAALQRKLNGYDELRRVAFLLNLVQNGFDYITDDAAFGRQKQLFVEESFFYGRNNCKDRVGVFAWLVKELTGLDVVFVRYEGNAASNGIGHIACAVNFKSAVEGDAVQYKNRRYVVCDPTYINASIGRTMPCYTSSKGEILHYAGK